MLIPKRLEEGDTVGVVAPARSLSIVHEKWIGIAQQFFRDRGMDIRFAPHCSDRWNETGGKIEDRVSDLMEMFEDRKIKAIITAIGGFNSNQLLPHLDYGTIRKNPKIFLGYSDITALHNGIHAKTGLVTFSGPHFSTLGQPHPMDYTVRYFDEVLCDPKPIVDITESPTFAEDEWFKSPEDPQTRALKQNPGWTIIHEGKAEGALMGGNIVTLQALIGTSYLPTTKGKVLFLEDSEEMKAHDIDRVLTHMQLAGMFKDVRGLLFGRFPSIVGFDENRLRELLLRVTQGTNYPIIANVDFGHTDPLATIPIGIPCLLDTFRKKIQYLAPAVQ
ncbi:MAG: S66 peptidase family protein [Candidatus Peregrinibacteria bacterium]